MNDQVMDVDTSMQSPVQQHLASQSVTQLRQPTVGYVWSAEMLSHRNMFDHPKEDYDPPKPDSEEGEDRHPETPARLEVIHRILGEHGLLSHMKRLPIREAEQHEVCLVHTEDLWEKVLSIQEMSEKAIMESKDYYEANSLYVNKHTTHAARLACGGVIESCLAVARGEVQKAFAIVRPPGHHAEPDEHMGFCFFNNVSVAAKTVQTATTIRKILILDWDVHHGNGTQSAFIDDPSVLYISLHRYEGGKFYPNGPEGGMERCGEGEGRGFNVNVPWPQKGMGDADYLLAFQRLVMPIAMSFDPELVIISAGFDAARGDHIGLCDITPAGYAHMTHMLSALADGKVVVALEGGYSLLSLSNSALAVARVLLGEAPPRLPILTASEAGTTTVWQVCRHQKQFWPVLDVAAAEPVHEYPEIAENISEILMSHRQDYLARHHNMLRVPLFEHHFSDALAAQAWSTPDLFDEKQSTLVVLVHAFGELQGETISPITLDLNVEKTHLIDFTRDIISWATNTGVALLDVNLTEKLPKANSRRSAPKSPDELKRGVVTYLWDNYIHLCPAKRVIFVGHGAGCAPIIETLAKRSVSVKEKVAHVMQIAPATTVPRAPDVPGLRPWYKENSTVFVSKHHPVFQEKQRPSHGKLYIVDQSRPILLLKVVIPLVKQKISEIIAS